MADYEYDAYSSDDEDSSWWDTISDLGSSALDYVTDINIGTGGREGSGLLDDVYQIGRGLVVDDKGNFSPTRLAGSVAGSATGIAQIAQLLGLIDDKNQPVVGYQGKIPDYTATRSRVADTYDPTRRPGSGGQRYFSDVVFASGEGIPTAQASTAEQAATLRELNIANPAQQRTPVTMMRGGIARLSNGGQLSQQERAAAAFSGLDAKSAEMEKQGITSEFMYNGKKRLGFENEEAKAAYEINEILRKLRAGEITIEEAEEFMRQNQPPQQMPQPVQSTTPMGNSMAQGGIASALPTGTGRYLGGTTDGMADQVPAMIDNQQPAALSDGEFIIPADVVSHLGNGNSDAGADQLYSMMDRIRQARTGTKKQGTQINPSKFMPS